MGKNRKKTRPEPTVPVNQLHLEEMARSLVERGLAASYILSPRRSDFTAPATGDHDAV